MAQYILKESAIAELKRRIFEEYNKGDDNDEIAQGVCASFKFFLEKMEVKEIDEQSVKTTPGTDMIRKERLRQIEAEGYDALHDRHHTPQVLCRAAAAYALYDDQSALVGNSAAKLWPWSNEFWKPKTQLRNLVRAGALIAAAIDKLQSEKGE